MPIRCRTLRSFLEYWVFSATERLFPSKGALESDSRTGPDWIAPERRDYRNVAQVAFGLKIPHSDKTSCALGAPPSMKMGAAPYRAVNGLFSVGVEAIFIAADFSRLIRTKSLAYPYHNYFVNVFAPQLSSRLAGIGIDLAFRRSRGTEPVPSRQ